MDRVHWTTYFFVAFLMTAIRCLCASEPPVRILWCNSALCPNPGTHNFHVSSKCNWTSRASTMVPFRCSANRHAVFIEFSKKSSATCSSASSTSSSSCCVGSISRTSSCKRAFENGIDCKMSAVVTVATGCMVVPVFGMVAVFTGTLLRIFGSDAGVAGIVRIVSELLTIVISSAVSHIMANGTAHRSRSIFTLAKEFVTYTVMKTLCGRCTPKNKRHYKKFA